ncbi:cryptochrome/photolyase family protein [Variovorax sp. HJSM1_2]|uniref:cryptochrome/photolyase family protein n=1 Tax=Variovorax sp. HJSM1_2 TaxID=3366263 RepID=UPI003BCC7672
MPHAQDKKYATGLVWFRRDLRSFDHAALYHALKSCRQVHCVFVFDQDILAPLLAQGIEADRRVEFILACVAELDGALHKLGQQAGVAGGPTGLIVRHASAREAIPALAQELHAQAVFANHDYEPDSQTRDAMVRGALAHVGISFLTSKDQVIFERDELLTQQGRPYGVFTPYKNAWLRKLNAFYLKPYPVARYAASLASLPQPQPPLPSLQTLGFVPSNLSSLPVPTGASGGAQLWEAFFERIDRYQATRDFPAVKGPSYLSVHLRFGTVSIRQLAAGAHQLALQGFQGAAVWLSELVWRDFYFQILHHFPHVEHKAFKPEYDAIKWEHGAHAKALFAAWCEGRTGYPLVDAAMAQINQSGYMHNRLRMVAASFLIKDLGIDWRWGEMYFARHLIDFDLSANNGGWQWAASSGCDAQPYFRIFNPVSQSQKFDPEGKFIRRYLPQLAALPTAALHAPWTAAPEVLHAAGVRLGENYPRPIIAHDLAREATLLRYAVVKKTHTLPTSAKPASRQRKS